MFRIESFSLSDARVRLDGQLPQHAMPAPFLTAILSLALAVIVPLIIQSATPVDGTSFVLVGPEFIAILSGLRFAVLVGSRIRRVYEMVFWLFVYVFLGIAPVIQMRLGQDTDTTPLIDHSLDRTTVLLVLVGCWAFLIGSLSVHNRQRQDLLPAIGEPARGVHIGRANLLTIACLGLFAYYATKLGVASMFTSRLQLDALRQVVWPDRTINTIIVGATSMGLLVSTIAQIYVRRQRAAAGLSTPTLLPALSFVALFVCVNPVNSARYIFGTVLLALLGAFGAYSTVKRFRAVALSSVMGLVYLFPAADMFRRSLDPAAQSQNPLESMLSGDFDSFSQISNTIGYVNESGITWGKQLLGVLFFWVPRSIWPDKAMDTGAVLAEWKGYLFKNLSAPLWSELYINGGWVLLILGMLAFGVAVGHLDKRSEAILARTRYPSVLACIVPFYLLIVLRGSLLQSVAFVSVVLIACAFVAEGKPKTKQEQPHRLNLSPAYDNLRRRFE